MKNWGEILEGRGKGGKREEKRDRKGKERQGKKGKMERKRREIVTSGSGTTSLA